MDSIVSVHEVVFVLLAVPINSSLSGTKGIQGINEKEMKGNLVSKGSWHDQYSSSPYVYAGNLPKDLTKGDLMIIFSQYDCL